MNTQHPIYIQLLEMLPSFSFMWFHTSCKITSKHISHYIYVIAIIIGMPWILKISPNYVCISVIWQPRSGQISIQPIKFPFSFPSLNADSKTLHNYVRETCYDKKICSLLLVGMNMFIKSGFINSYVRWDSEFLKQ